MKNDYVMLDSYSLIVCPARAFLRGCDYSESVVMWLSGSKNFFHDLQLCAVGLSLVDSSSRA
jgi:hypothetical protein